MNVDGYDVVHADPAWQFDNAKTGGSMSSAAAKQYEVMTTDAIAALPVATAVRPNAVCGLWATVPMLPDALRVLDAWGFAYKTADFWIKARLESPRAQSLAAAIQQFLRFGKAFGGIDDLRHWRDSAMALPEVVVGGKIGMGFWLRGNVELLLIGTRGKVVPPRLSLRNFHVSVPGAHSAKPAEARARLEAIADGVFGYSQWRGVELFAREVVPRWDPVGLAIDGRKVEDVLQGIRKYPGRDRTPKGTREQETRDKRE